MDTLTYFLDINSAFFKLLGYPMSYIEFFGTILGLISVWLATKANIHTWSIGILNVIAFFVIYYQVQLYSDMFLQIYFFAMSIYGWWNWKSINNTGKGSMEISALASRSRIIYLLIILIGFVSLGFVISNIHSYYSTIFSKPAAYPYTDALTTILSIVATILMAQKKIECWILWIIVDLISIYLYSTKGIIFISIEYIIFLILATIGMFDWLKYLKNAKGLGSGQVYAAP